MPRILGLSRVVIFVAPIRIQVMNTGDADPQVGNLRRFTNRDRFSCAIIQVKTGDALVVNSAAFGQ